jgi:hypothetical protein
MPTTASRKPTSSAAHDRRQAVESELAPLYALAGLTDLVAEKVTSTIRTRLSESQQQASERFAALKHQPGELERQAKLSVDELTAFLRTLPDQLRDFPTQARTQLAVLQQQAESYRSTAETAYAEFAGRGKSAVDEAIVSARKSAGRAQAKGKDAWEDATETATEATDEVLERAQETVTAARKRATGRTATATVTPRSSVKTARTRAVKATEKKAPAKAPAKKSPAAASPATKSPTTKKAAAKKAPAKKATAKKA